ncbi:MAG TPA: hypothetical protein VKB19_03420 [Pedobacter sp.]|nr:hypothetical protein [Pedobacter sp.]
MKKIIALLFYVCWGYQLHAQELNRIFDDYVEQERYPNSIYVWGGINRIPLPGKIFIHPRLLGDTEHFPKVIVVDGIDAIRALLHPEIRDKVSGLVVTVPDSVEFITTIAEIINFPNLRYLHVGAEPGVVDRSYAHEQGNRYKLPDNILLLKKLEIVGFTGGYVDLDDAFRKLSELKSLKALSLNMIYKPIPARLTNLKQIRLISLIGNSLKGQDLSVVKWESVRIWRPDDEMLEELARMPSLNSLELKSPKFNINVLLNFKRLKRLSISGIALEGTDLIQQISLMKNLTSLKLTRAQGLDLTGLSKLKSLKHLELTGYNYPLKNSGDVSEISELTHLEELKLGAYYLSRIPDVFDKLKNLKFLSLWSGERDLPESIFLLPKLDSLVISGTGIRSLPDLPVYGFRKIKALRINSTNVHSLPEALLNLPDLEILDISKNEISSLPADGWPQLKKLKHLYLQNNKLGAVPEAIGQLNELQFLNASHNKIRAIPASLGNCIALKRLILNNNQISFFPEELKAASALEELRLANNPNIDGPSVWKLILAVPRSDLFIDLSNTGLSKLPESGKWKTMNFTELILDSNKLQTLPPTFSQIDDFNRISLRGNPLLMPQELADVRIVSRADLKIVFDQLNVPMTGKDVSKADYALVLLDRITYLYRSKDWERVVVFADSALKLDAASYHKSFYTSYIGIARFHTKDYKGAIKELKRFEHLEYNNAYYSANLYGEVELCLSDAYLALGDKISAAQVSKRFAKNRDEVESFFTFLSHYLKSKDRKGINDLLERALPAFAKALLNERQPNGNPRPSFLCEYAEVLIIAGKAKESAALLRSMTDENYRKPYVSIKNCLLAIAVYLSKEKTFDQARDGLAAAIAAQQKISKDRWSFETLNNWSDFSSNSNLQRRNLESLQRIATEVTGK